MERSWTWKDYDLIRTRYPLEGISIAKEFPGSAKDTVRSRAVRIDAGPPHQFTEAEMDLVQRYGSTLGTALIFLIPDRTPAEIEQFL